MAKYKGSIDLDHLTPPLKEKLQEIIDGDIISKSIIVSKEQPENLKLGQAWIELIDDTDEQTPSE